MGKLRHIAVVVRDLEASARFYEQVFEMTRAHADPGIAIYLSDGTMNLALLDYAFVNRQGASTADGKHGTHHFGFVVDDIPAAQADIEAAGGVHRYDIGERHGLNFERKFADPEGIIFDISEKGWYGALTAKTKASAA